MTTEVDSSKMLNGKSFANSGSSSEPLQNDTTDTHSPILNGKMSQGATQENPQLKSPIPSTTNVTYTADDDIIQNQGLVPPPIPHVETNQVSLALIVRNLTIFTIKEISQYMKTNIHVNPSEGSSTKKLAFLKLIIFLRNQFLKLYVLIKWCKTIKNNNFHVMIDLLNWFRTTTMAVNGCIWALRGNLTSMTNAKLPNVDLVSALEVLSLGRTNLPSHNFKLSAEMDPLVKIPPDLILKKLKDLNLMVSIKVAMMDLPRQFHNYYIANGRIYIKVENEFEIQLSTIDRHSPLFFVDVNLLLSFNEKEIILPLNKQRLEKLINEILFKSNKPLFALYDFLHKYVITLQLYSLHLELITLETNGKFSGGNLVHSYDPKKCIISIRYWLNSKMGNKGKIMIGIGRESENLILKWDNKNAINNKRMTTVYNNIVTNLEAIFDEIMFNHCQLIRSDLLSKGVFQEDEEDQDVLLFEIPTTCLTMAAVQLKIDLINGIFYFKNPTPLLSTYVQQINRADSIEDLTRVLQKLKLDKIISILRNMFEKTGWVCSKVIRLEKRIKTTLNDIDSKSLLQQDLFICLPNWPVNWYLILSVISSKSSCMVEKRIGKVVSLKGKWELTYLDNTNTSTAKLETITYQKVVSLQKSILHRIVNHMLIDSLNQLKIRNRICPSDSSNSLLPECIINDSTNMPTKDSPTSATKQESEGTTLSEADTAALVGDPGDAQVNTGGECTSVIALELESFLEGSKALSSILESSMFLRIDYTHSEIRLYGRFKRNTMLIQCKCDDLLIHFIPDGSLTFFFSENFTTLSLIVQYLTSFRQKLMQLVVLTDVVERLHKNFASEYFKIVSLKVNEISFKYLKNSQDEQDCIINIITKKQMVKNLTVQLAASNPQHIIQPFIDSGRLDYHFIFNYLQFTSTLFATLKHILTESNPNKNEDGSIRYTTVNLGLHNLNEYQLVYCNREAGTKITLYIELKNVTHNTGKSLQFYIHFSKDEHITTKSRAYPMVHQVCNQVFMLDPKLISMDKSNSDMKNECKYPDAIKLVNGISCNSEDIEPILMDIHDILKVDSNVGNNDNGSELLPTL
ncbi:hypothetical protein NCAS_0J00290 [Naumovozyma castellii]|uniref:Mediator of RNA polymerase II transcription subunit 14 n=1 Tax=Naumovozyma castellii TaxID=27288 RepID=G0VKH5_NAUCA|nr:hypothetical protein NCAS_0J00290 [Naumovozyma castellii CBS 4309]CCC72009.1 hypothetical protein NCAS_0J00290 [Naumovozyma castellii CBS 4309]